MPQLTTKMGVSEAEYKRLKKTLLESERRFKASVENMLDCFGIYSAIRDETGHIVDFRVEYVNEAACKNNRMNQAEQIGKRLLQLLPAHRKSGLFDDYCRVVETGKPLIKESLIYEDVYGKKRLTRAFDIRAAKLGDGFAATWRDVTKRKEAEENTKQAANEWQTTFDSITDLVSVHDKDFKLVRVNKAFADTFGAKPEELLGKTCYEVVHKTKQHWPSCPHKQVLKTKKPVTVDFFEPWLGAHLEISASPILDENGEVIGSVHIIKDITERKLAETALKDSEEKFRTIFENATDQIAYVDKHGKILDVNPRVEDIFGYKRDEVIGLNITELGVFRPRDIPKAFKLLKDIVREGKSTNLMEFELRDKNGNKVFVEVNVKVIKRNGRAEGILSILRDVTPRKKAEEILRESEERYRTLVETSSDCICNLDLEGNFLYMNPAGLELYGMSKEKVKGMHCTKLATPAYSKLLNEALEKARRGESGRFQHENGTPSGTRWFESILTPIKKDLGKIVSLLLISRDITERKKDEEELKKQHEELKNMEVQLLQAAKLAAIGELGASIVHELNQPLGGIKGFTQVLLKELGEESLLRKDLLEIEKQADRMAKVIDNIKTFTRKTPFEFYPVDVNTSIEHALMLMSRQLKIHEITVVKDLDTHLPKVNADPNQLQEVFLNVISNAKYALNVVKKQKDKKLTIITKSLDNFVEVSFADNGCGIAEENLNKVFDPFFTTKSPGAGTGLGLSISSRIVKNHNGLIDISSVKGKEKVTVLKILLPVA